MKYEFWLKKTSPILTCFFKLRLFATELNLKGNWHFLSKTFFLQFRVYRSQFRLAILYLAFLSIVHNSDFLSHNSELQVEGTFIHFRWIEGIINKLIKIMTKIISGYNLKSYFEKSYWPLIKLTQLSCNLVTTFTFLDICPQTRQSISKPVHSVSPQKEIKTVLRENALFWPVDALVIPSCSLHHLPILAI